MNQQEEFIKLFHLLIEDEVNFKKRWDGAIYFIHEKVSPKINYFNYLSQKAKNNYSILCNKYLNKAF